jgi:hypothetical protein
MNHSEELMSKVREAEDGTQEKARAWVAYMRHAKVPGTEPRRLFADMMRRHLRWPLSVRVAVKTPQGYLEGKICKHDRDYQHKCMIDFSPNLVSFDAYPPRHVAIVPFRNIKKLK